MKVLEDGYVEVLDKMGGDGAVVEAARISYEYAENIQRRPDEDLINYLMRNDHGSPFEQAIIKFKIAAPFTVMRHLMRYRTASVNEASGRYSKLPSKYHMTHQFLRPSKTNKQMAEHRREENTQEDTDILAEMDAFQQAAYTLYNKAIARGMANEQARSVLPLSGYTTTVFTIDARNLMNLLAQRLGPGVDADTKAYANVMMIYFEQWMPMTSCAFKDNILEGMRLSRTEIEIIRQIIHGKDQTKTYKQSILNEAAKKAGRLLICPS